MEAQGAYLDRLLNRFEASWKSEHTADLAALVPEEGHVHRQAVLVALIKVDQEYRWQYGDQKRIEQYLDEWPEIREDKKILQDLVEAECIIPAPS